MQKKKKKISIKNSKKTKQTLSINTFTREIMLESLHFLVYFQYLNSVSSSFRFSFKNAHLQSVQSADVDES